MVPLSHLSRDWNADGGEGRTSTPQSFSLSTGSSKPPRGTAQHSVSKTGSISKIIRAASCLSPCLFFMTGEIRWLFWSLPFIDQSLIIFHHSTSTNTALLFFHILKQPTVFFMPPPISNYISTLSPTGQIHCPQRKSPGCDEGNIAVTETQRQSRHSG